MKPNSHEEHKQHAFDSFCKKVLKNEVRNHYVEVKRQRERESTFSELSQQEIEKLFVTDDYPSDNIIFSVSGYDVAIKSDLLAEALATLSQQKRDIILLHYFIGLSDKEIAELLDMVRRTVHYKRTSSLQELKKRLEGNTDE